MSRESLHRSKKWDLKRQSMMLKGQERVASGRGSGTFELAYTTRNVVATVVKSSDTNEVVERMKKALAGEKAAVMISPVDDLVML
jgi:hypothetical protein